MNDSLFRILYCSHNLTGETGSEERTALEEILQSARANNRECGITGALLFSTGYFAQVLEGPRLAIEHTFERIQRDRRHGQVTVLDCTDIGARDFPSWSMAQVKPGSEQQGNEAAKALHAAMGHPSDAGRGVLDLMRTLVIQSD